MLAPAILCVYSLVCVVVFFVTSMFATASNEETGQNATQLIRAISWVLFVIAVCQFIYMVKELFEA